MKSLKQICETAVVLTNEVTGIPGFPHPLQRQIMMVCMGIYRYFDDNS